MMSEGKKQFKQFHRVAMFLISILVLVGNSLFATNAGDSLKTGKVIKKVVCSDNVKQSYSLYLPKAYNWNQKWPVLFAFEPKARVLLPHKLFKSAAEAYGYIIICPTNAKNGPNDQIVKAMVAVWKDVSTRFAIDKNRVYATGFSGGARMSSFFHLVIRHPIRGIISVGAGISTAIKADKIKSAHYYGIVGFSDFNYPEVVRLEKTLKVQGTPHRFIYYKANHRWPPESICTRAIEWMELMAMKENIIPKDDRQDFINSAFAKENELAKKREKRGEIFFAAEEYDAIARVFDGLKDISKIKEKVAQLKKLKKYTKSRH
jgi:dienelactone hydrolase